MANEERYKAEVKRLEADYRAKVRENTAVFLQELQRIEQRSGAMEPIDRDYVLAYIARVRQAMHGGVPAGGESGMAAQKRPVTCLQCAARFAIVIEYIEALKACDACDHGVPPRAAPASSTGTPKPRLRLVTGGRGQLEGRT